MLVPSSWGWIAVIVYLALDLVVILLVSLWSRRPGWDGRHRLALAGGAALTYAWHSFPQKPVVPVSATLDVIGNIVFSVGAILVIWSADAAQEPAARSPGGLTQWPAMRQSRRASELFESEM